MNIISKINSEQLKKDIPDFSAGDTVRVHQLIQEGSKERVQIFEGVVLFRDGGGINETCRVRKMSHSVGVERVFPLHSPKISKIEIKQRGKVRRARLYYLRELSGKAAKIKESLAHFKKDAAKTKASAESKKAATEAPDAAAIDTKASKQTEASPAV